MEFSYDGSVLGFVAIIVAMTVIFVAALAFLAWLYLQQKEQEHERRSDARSAATRAGTGEPENDRG